VTAELIAIGSEMLRFGRSDTNGDWLTLRLNEHGIEVVARAIVEDHVEAIATQLRAAATRARFVIVTGGLGPTEDDRTRAAFSTAFDLRLTRDEAVVARIRDWFESRGRVFNDRQRCQADRPSGAEWIDNPIGTAPGFLLRHEECLLAALPGVPAEMKAMFSATLAPRVVKTGQASLAHRRIRIGGRTESWVESQVRDLYGEEQVETTILSGGEGIELHLRAKGDTVEDVRGRVDRIASRMRDRLGEDLYGDGDKTLAEVVGQLLGSRGASLATAESCTAGMLAAAVTDVPGSSNWFRGGWVVYSNALKTSLAGIEPGSLATHGAVSEFVARELSESVRRRCRTTYGVGVTGIAGPGGGTSEKPIGLVHLALAGADRTEHWKLRLVGDRRSIRRRTVVFALDRLRRRLLTEGSTEDVR